MSMHPSSAAFSSALAAWGDYCRVPKKSGADTFSKKQELIRRKPLTEKQRHGEKFSPGTLTPSSASATFCDDSTAKKRIGKRKRR